MNDHSFTNSALDGEMEKVQNMLNDPLITNDFTGDYICELIRRMIKQELVYCFIPEGPPKLTPEIRYTIIKSILSIPKAIELIDSKQATSTFGSATHFGPSIIVEMLLNLPGFIEKVEKEKIIWALQNHFVIDILSQSPDKYNLIEKDSSDILSVLLDNEYIFSLIDSEIAQRILQWTVTRPNAKSLSVIFNNQKLLDKIDNEEIRNNVRYIMQKNDQKLISDVLNNENITKYLLQEDWSKCYQFAKTDEIKKLLEPYYYRESYFDYFVRIATDVYYSEFHPVY